MKTKKPFLRLVALAALSLITGNEVVAQTNIGADCGCPAYSTRQVVNVTTLSATNWVDIPNAYGKELQNNQSITLTCDKTWLIDEKLYISSGSTINIQPGTVVKSSLINYVNGTLISPASQTLANARALIIERGGKIMAPGTEACPIIFTAAADNLNGNISVAEKGLWGGVLICGKAKNNLTLALNGPFQPGQSGKMAVADGLGVLEGFAASIPQDQFGVQLSAPSNVFTQATSASIPQGSYTLVMALGTNAETSTNGLSSTKISIAVPSGSTLPNYYFVGMGVSGTGITAGSTIASISTSSPYSSTNPRITLSTATSSTTAVASPITFTGTYPAANPTGVYYTVGTTLPAGLVNSSTGPFVLSGANPNVYVNYAQPYYAPTGSNSQFVNDDNSGVMTYASIRHSGANLLVGSEINGLTLASVGSGTKIENIEIVSCADDNIEIFGGTVNLKYCTTLFGNDDMYDYDLGWDGKAQFLFGMKADYLGQSTGVGPDNDNGFECDGGDNSSIEAPSNPTIYNATIIGNAKVTGTADNRALAAMNMKEGARGTISNSVFAGFKNGLNLEDGTVGSANTVHNAYHHWTNATLSGMLAGAAQSVKVKCNTFVGVTSPLIKNASVIAATGTVIVPGSTSTDLTQFLTTDKNTVLTQQEGLDAGFKYAFAINPATTGASINDVTTLNDVVPKEGQAAFLLGTGTTACPQAPNDGFFATVNYRGAFAPSNSNENWLSDWSYSQVLNSTLGLVSCPSDINGDGVIDVNDFLILSGVFGQSCN